MKSLLCIALLLSSFLCTAQISSRGDFEVTPVIGYSQSFFIHSLFFGGSSVNNVQLGVYGTYYLSDDWSLQSGLLYQNMGVKAFKFDIFEYNYSEKTRYFTLPVMIQRHFGNRNQWHVNYGASVGFLTSAKSDYHDGNGFIDIKNIARPVQLGLNSGIGYRFAVSPTMAILIENANMIALTKTSDETSGNNIYISFNIGAIFKL